LGEALVGLYSTIYRDFKYELGATSVRTTLPELLRLRKGVCQDFAHLAVGCLRSVGLPARYVSGYVETSPPPGQPKLEGSDASHAWTSVLVPGGEWIDLDPTNDHFADSRYIVTAWGRDFRDVSPLKGVVYTESKKSTLEVKVDVFRVNPDGTLS
jgi:transglutaminase-like putative cysteine protease